MKKEVKTYLIVSAILMFVLGFVCIFNPGAGLLSVAWLIGILTLLSGVFTLMFSLKMQRIMPNAATNTLSGMLQIMLGIFFLAGNFFVAASLPVVFGLWIIIEGISLAVQSFDFKKQGVSQWWGMLIFGICTVILGVVALKNPITAGKTLSILIGIGIIAIAVVKCYIVSFINKIDMKIQYAKDRFNDAKKQIADNIERKYSEQN